MQKVSIGRIVRYILTKDDAQMINSSRVSSRPANFPVGAQIQMGNGVSEGEIYPLIITRVWGDPENGYINGQVFLDGNDLYWVTSKYPGGSPGTWHWPERD